MYDIIPQKKKKSPSPLFSTSERESILPQVDQIPQHPIFLIVVADENEIVTIYSPDLIIMG